MEYQSGIHPSAYVVNTHTGTPSGAVALLTVTFVTVSTSLGQQLTAYPSPQWKCYPKHCYIKPKRPLYQTFCKPCWLQNAKCFVDFPKVLLCTFVLPLDSGLTLIVQLLIVVDHYSGIQVSSC